MSVSQLESPQRSASRPAAQTMLDKIWARHVVLEEEGAPAVLYIDTHLIHEVTSPQAFALLRERGLKVRRPDRTFATVDHAIPTRPLALELWPRQAAVQVETLRQNCRDFGVELFDLSSQRQGIVHVIGPELGITQPGMTVVCGDSHTSTHGAFGALAFGIGTSEVGHVLATQCLLQTKPKSFAINIEGELPPGVSAKDLILAIITANGTDGGAGHVFEYRGSAIRNLDMAGRMTICNMSIEGGARAGLVAPDEVTYQWLKERPYSPSGEDWKEAVSRWKQLPSDPDATYDKEFTLKAKDLAPMVSYGTNPGQCVSVNGRIPDPGSVECPQERRSVESALEYMELKPGQTIEGHSINVVFIGSCTNGRLEDLRAAAGMVKGKRVSVGVRALVVPGSKQVKSQAEAEGLDRVFTEAGFEWREAGCSMCLGMNDDKAGSGEYVASTSNRNFRGRQGPGARTLLMSPTMAAAAAVHGRIVDVRQFA